MNDVEDKHWCVNYQEWFFIEELKTKMQIYPHKIINKNGVTAIHFEDYLMKLNTNYFNKIKSSVIPGERQKKGINQCQIRTI